MKLMSLLLLLATTQYSCINDAEVVNPDIIAGGEGNLALSLEIPNTNALGRANNAESSDENEIGSKSEYNVSSVTVYLFDAQTKIYTGSYDLQNIQGKSLDETKSTISYTANRINVQPGTYNIFAIANGKANAANISTQDKFLNTIDATTYKDGVIASAPTNGFVMTNRGAANLNVTVSKPTNSENVTKVSIRLERVVAKIEIAQTKASFPLLDSIGSTYATIKIGSFRIVNLATQFYTFRHTAVLNSFQKPDAYTDANFGDVDIKNNGYVIDPYFFNKTLEGAKDFTNSDGFFAQALVDKNNTNGWSLMGGVGSKSFIYCLENCMYQNAQVNGYTTGVMFLAHIEIDPNHVFNENGIESNQLNWATLFYFNCNFYTSINAVRKLQINNLPESINDQSTDEVLAIHNIKRFSKSSNYSCFYNYWIKHLDNNIPTESGVMEFGIVRNNIYRLSVTKVAGLGTGNPYIEPDQPNEPKAELEIDLDVFQWAVRNQNVELE